MVIIVDTCVRVEYDVVVRARIQICTQHVQDVLVYRNYTYVYTHVSAACAYVMSGYTMCVCVRRRT